MSDSLRDQMLKVGFKETAAAKKQAKRQGSSKHKSQSTAKPTNKSATKGSPKHNTGPSSMERENIAKREAVAERKRIKAEIKTIIDAEKISNTHGESTHSYLVGKRIKQMFVTEELREKLVAGSVVITRLNGATYLIPKDTGQRVQALNPDWVVLTPGSEQALDDDDEYADYQVPDDLKW